MNLEKPLNERFGPALPRDIDLLVMGPSLAFAGIVVAMLATAPDSDRLQERLFAIVMLVVVAAAFMFVTGQWVMLILIFIGGPAVVLIAVLLVYTVLRLVALWEGRE